MRPRGAPLTEPAGGVGGGVVGAACEEASPPAVLLLHADEVISDATMMALTKRIRQRIAIKVKLERINLYVPEDMRKRLKARAKRLHMTEAEATRDLLARALDREEEEKEEDLYRRVAETTTPEMQQRTLGVIEALERLHGDELR